MFRHLGVATDITEQKVAQEQALAERRAAGAINDELKSFAYSMSHDMKAPSNTLHQLISELIDQHGESLNDDAQELVEMSLITIAKCAYSLKMCSAILRLLVRKLNFKRLMLLRFSRRSYRTWP